MGAIAIELQGLSKDYGRGRGVFDVSLTVYRGEVFGFLGPNGAGKTTTMRHLMGFIKPGLGTATINGLDCFSKRATIQRTLGYLPGEIACMDEMSGTDFLEFMARMKGLVSRKRLHELTDYFELDPLRKIRKMSKGTKQKIGLVCAFMGNPDLLLLDEPTSGLDPLMQSRFIDLVLEEKKRGTTIFLSSHLFEEVERTCDKVAFIREGRMVAVESMEQVRKSRKRVYLIRFNDARERARYAAMHPDAQNRGDASVEVVVSGGTDAFVKDLALYAVTDLAAREQTLEELFLHLYGVDQASKESKPSVLKGGNHE